MDLYKRLSERTKAEPRHKEANQQNTTPKLIYPSEINSSDQRLKFGRLSELYGQRKNSESQSYRSKMSQESSHRGKAKKRLAMDPEKDSDDSFETPVAKRKTSGKDAAADEIISKRFSHFVCSPIVIRRNVRKTEVACKIDGFVKDTIERYVNNPDWTPTPSGQAYFSHR